VLVVMFAVVFVLFFYSFYICRVVLLRSEVHVLL
jgi:hypothetical protein